MRARRAEGRRTFARIGWDEALDTIAHALRRRSRRRPTARRRSCPTAMPARWGCCNRARWTAGSSTGSAHRCSIARSARRPARPAGLRSIGAAMGMDVEQFVDSRLILIWGSNPIASNLHFWTRAQEAKRRGAQAHRDRSLSQRHRGEVPPAHRADARHRRRAGARHDARADRRGPRRSRLRRALHAGLRRARERAPPNGRRERVAAICGIPREHRARPRARIRHRRGRRRSASTTACSATPAAATRCARSPACRRWSARGAIPRAARCCRRRARIPSIQRGARASRPDPRHAAHDQHVARSAMRCSTRTIRRFARSTSTTRNPLAVAPESAKVDARLRARRSVLRRARDLPDRHRRLRRHPAAGDDAARAARRAQLVRPSVRAREQPVDRAARRSAAQHRGVSPARARAWASPSRASATATTTLARAGVPLRRSARMQGIDWDALKRRRASSG